MISPTQPTVGQGQDMPQDTGVTLSGSGSRPADRASKAVSPVPASIPNADFDKLRAERDAGLELIAKEMWLKLGGDPDEAPTFHCREYHSPCYCACPDEPCEHQFAGWREFDDGHGGEQFCESCGTGATSHSMRFLP